MLPLLLFKIFIGFSKWILKVDTYEVRIKGVTYRIRAYTNAEARWAGVRKYYLSHNTPMTISMLYQHASCYRVDGRKSIPW